jgi:undecaprenyl-diphosphatase
MERSILRFLNGLVELPGIHQFCWLVDQPWSPILVLALVLVVSANRRRWLEIPGVVAAVLVSDPLCARVLKPLIARPRPCAEWSWVAAPFDCGASFSMPSCHATNLFAVAMVLNRPWAFLLATLVAVARTISGVHYPGDLVAGAVLGVAVGWVIRVVIERLQRRLER